MATNKNALIRYLTIDKCLQNTLRKWTLADLISACSDALYEYEGKNSYVSKRTVQLDIQTMRSNKLGYNAPIVVYDKKYYKYDGYNFSITDIPITEIDLDILSESMEMLKQFKNFSLFAELNGVIQKLEDKIFRETKDQSPIIHLDKNDHLLGIQYLDILYQSIAKKMAIIVDYQSFKARKPTSLVFVPFILKQYNNRWFVVGQKRGSNAILTLALDRMVNVVLDPSLSFTKNNFDPEKYYENTIGVSVLSDKDIINIELKVDRLNAPYVMTKPFHHSQILLGEYPDGSIKVGLKVHHNYELERLILGFGPSLKVLKPERLRRKIKKLLKESYQNYFSS